MKCNEKSMAAPRFNCCPGEHLRPLYKSQIMKDGSIKLHDAGYQDTDAFIESFRESCELKTLIKRYEAGDLQALMQVNTFDGDFSMMPNNLGQALEILQTAQSAFDYLPKQTKDAYGNDYKKWIQDYGSDAFMKSIGFEPPAVAPDPVTEGGETK